MSLFESIMISNYCAHCHILNWNLLSMVVYDIFSSVREGNAVIINGTLTAEQVWLGIADEVKKDEGISIKKLLWSGFCYDRRKNGLSNLVPRLD